MSLKAKERYIGTLSRILTGPINSYTTSDKFSPNAPLGLGTNLPLQGNVLQYRIISWTVTNATEASYEYTAFVPYFTNFTERVPIPPMSTVNIFTADNVLFFRGSFEQQLETALGFDTISPSNAGGFGEVVSNITVEAQEVTQYSG